MSSSQKTQTGSRNLNGSKNQPEPAFPKNLIKKPVSGNLVVSSEDWRHYLHYYYIINFGLILLYPLHRFCGLDSPELKKKDWIGYSKENTIIVTFFLFVFLRFKKYCSLQHFVVQAIFFAKVCVLALYFIIAHRFFVAYLLLLIITYLTLNTPINRGAHNFVTITSVDHFNEYVLGWVNGKPPKRKANEGNKNNYKEMRSVFVECWAPFAESCTYTRSLWAEYSRKYKTGKMLFADVNVVQHPEIAKDLDINTSGISKQLPTLIMYEDGQEIARFPSFNEDGKVGKVLKYESRLLAKYFDLETRYFETMGT